VPKASLRALAQYVTGILLVFLLTWHLIRRVPWLWGVETFRDTLSPEFIYEEITAYGVILLLFAYATLIHGFNGLRNVLLEWTSGRYKPLINLLVLVLLLVFAALATYTVIGVKPPQ